MPHALRSSGRLCAALVLSLAALDAACLKVPAGDLDVPSDKAEPPTDAKQVIDRYVTALGGADALRAIAQRTVEARMTFLPETGCTNTDENCRTQEAVGGFLLQSTADQRLYRRTTIEKQIDEEGYDGRTGWQFRRGYLVLEDAEESTVTREDAALHWYFDFEKRGVVLTLEKKTRDKDYDGNARVLDGVRWSSKGDILPPKTQWFDRATGLLVEEILEDPESEPPITQTIIYDDYRPVDGVRVAHKIRLLNQFGDRLQEIVFLNQRIDHSPIAPEVFAVPNVPPPPKAKDERLVVLAKAREAAAAAPKDRDAQVALTRAAWAAAHFEDAAAAAEAVLKIDPKEAEALWILARARVLQGRLKEAGPLLDRAEKAGIRDLLVHAQRAWIASHQRDFTGVANALDHLGPANAPLAGRYRTFAGKPLQVSLKGDGCAVELPFVSEGSIALVEAQIGDQKFRALIDTGASDVILDAQLAEKLKVPIRSRSQLGETKAEIGHGQIDALSLGALTVSGIPVDVFPHEILEQMSGGVVAPPSAVIGSRVLELFLITFDVPAKKITFVNPTPKCKSALNAHRTGQAAPFYLHETHFLYVRAAMNSAEGLFLVNTGMQGVGITATANAFARAGIGAPPLRRNEPALVDVDEFTVGSHSLGKLRGAYGYFEQEESGDQFRIDGMIGLDALGRSRWTLDFPERRFYFSPSTATPATPAAPPAKTP